MWERRRIQSVIGYFPSSALAFIASGVLALLLAGTTWRRTAISGNRQFAWLMIAAAFWGITRACEELAVGADAKITWAKIEYIGIMSVSPLWLLFAQAYTRQAWSLTRGKVALFFVVPGITTLLAFTNERHRLIWSAALPSSPDPQSHLIYEHGAGFLLAISYSYLMLAIGSMVIFWAVIRFPTFYRSQLVALILGVVAPWASNVLYVTGHSPIPGLDPTSIAFSLSGLVWFWGAFRYRLFDLAPVARDVMIEQMEDGILVLDPHHRVVDINPAATRLIGGANTGLIGQFVHTALASTPELFPLCLHTEEAQAEIRLRRTPDIYLDVRVTPLATTRDGVRGRLVQMRDITARKQTDLQVQTINARLHTQLAANVALQTRLREEAIRDPLTGLYNRRYLHENIDSEIANVAHDDAPLSIVMLDIDHFKRINDQFGHKAGDAVLRAVGNLLRSQIREKDFVCRYGGEEFVIVLPTTDMEPAHERANQWRAAIEAMVTLHDGIPLRVTISAGVARFPLHGTEGDALLTAADAALYGAKNAGRNRVMSFIEPHTHLQPIAV